MLTLMFSARGRIGRGSFWKGVVLLLLAGVAATALAVWLGAKVSSGSDDGVHFEINPSGSLPATLVFLAYGVAAAWAGLCLGIKRYHDRDKSGAWVLIQFVPLVGPLWYLVEAGFLAGTPGPNRFGPAGSGALPSGAVAAF